jgi:hypothetical protein
MAQKQVSPDPCRAVRIVQYDAVQPGFSCRRGGQAALIRAWQARDQQRVTTLPDGLAYPELKRAQLVATQTKRHGIVAFDEKCSMAKLRSDPVKLFQRSRAHQQWNPGEVTIGHGAFSVFSSA